MYRRTYPSYRNDIVVDHMTNPFRSNNFNLNVTEAYRHLLHPTSRRRLTEHQNRKGESGGPRSKCEVTMAATPTPSKALPLPSSASSHHHAMTPTSINHHLSAFSPLPSAPRSVGQSPANLSRKSPAHAVMVQQSQSRSQSQSQQQQHQTNRGSDSSGPLAYDTPTAAALGLNLNLPGLDPAVAARVAAVNLRADDEERKRRIETILALLRHRPGRVSEEGLERLAKRCELECLWEDGPAELRTLTMAGSGVLLEVRILIVVIIIAIIHDGIPPY